MEQHLIYRQRNIDFTFVSLGPGQEPLKLAWTLHSSAQLQLSLKWWHHKNEICKIMGFVKIFWKKNVQDAYLPKISILGQIVSEILAQLCSDDSI